MRGLRAPVAIAYCPWGEFDGVEVSVSKESEFPKTSWDAWKAKATEELKGADFDAKLVTKTVEGIRILPVYETPAPETKSTSPAAEADETTGQNKAPVLWPTDSLPGHAPHLRGGGEEGSTSGAPRICTLIDGLAPEEIATRARDELEGGVRALWFQRTGFVDLDELDTALEAVDPAEVELIIRPTLPAHAVAAYWIAWILRRHPAPPDVRIHFGLDPLARLARTGLFDLDRTERDTVALAQRLQEQFPRSTALAVSTLPYHNAGASAAEELAAALATGVSYLRWLTRAGFDLDDAASQLYFRFALGPDQFLEIAKLRAFRYCWSRVLDASGYPGAVGPRIHTVDSDRMLTVFDPWVNLLRTTLATFAAITAGADLHTPQPWTSRLAVNDPLARRIARNTGTILLEESQLSHVVDPAGGSTYVESLTRELAETAWSLFQELEGEGMEAELLSGRFRSRVSDTWSRKEAELKTRRRPVTGVSEYANLSESRPRAEHELEKEASRAFAERKRVARSARAGIRVTLPPAPNQALEEAIVLAGEATTLEEVIEAWPIGRSGEIASFPVVHDGDPFEQLRLRAETASQIRAASSKDDDGPRVFLANLGTVAMHGARATFARGAFAAGGLPTVGSEGTGTHEPREAANILASEFRASGCAVVCLCGTDEDYATMGSEVIQALRDAGANWIVRAGSPVQKVPSDEMTDDWIHLGSDLPSSLEKALTHAVREVRP